MKQKSVVLLVVVLAVIILLIALRGCNHDTPLIYLRIDDESTSSLNTVFPGADIDAIEIIRDGEIIGTAKNVVESHILDGAQGNINKYKDVTQLLGIPNYDANKDQNYVSLGGNGGYVIMRMSTPLEPGDTLRVYEIGASSGGTAEPSAISIASSKAGPFKRIGKGSGQFDVVVPMPVS